MRKKFCTWTKWKKEVDLLFLLTSLYKGMEKQSSKKVFKGKKQGCVAHPLSLFLHIVAPLTASNIATNWYLGSGQCALIRDTGSTNKIYYQPFRARGLPMKSIDFDMFSILLWLNIRTNVLGKPHQSLPNRCQIE